MREDNKIKFVLKEDTVLEITNSEIIFSKGVINFKNIILDKNQSAPEFVSYMNDLYKNGYVITSEDNPFLNDLKSLEAMGFLRREIILKEHRILVISEDEEFECYQNNLKYADIIPVDNLANEEDIKSFRTIKNNKLITDRFNDVISKGNLQNYECIIIVDSYYHSERIRFWNRLINYLGIYGIFAISDSEIFFLTMTKAKETGCFECLESQIKTKLKLSNQIYNDYPSKKYLNNSDKLLKLGFLSNIIEQLVLKKYSDLLGNVIIFNKNNFEYRFDANRIQTACPVCVAQGNIFHEEQNVKTINVLNNLEE